MPYLLKPHPTATYEDPPQKQQPRLITNPQDTLQLLRPGRSREENLTSQLMLMTCTGHCVRPYHEGSNFELVLAKQNCGASAHGHRRRLRTDHCVPKVLQHIEHMFVAWLCEALKSKYFILHSSPEGRTHKLRLELEAVHRTTCLAFAYHTLRMLSPALPLCKHVKSARIASTSGKQFCHPIW